MQIPIPMKLIYKEAHGGAWTRLPWDDRLGIASLAAVEAQQIFDPDKGAFSTLAVNCIRNAFRSEVARIKTRMKYDGVQVSSLLESQIPEGNAPDPEKQAIFRDNLARLGADAQEVVNLALHTPLASVEKKPVNILKGIQDRLGWTAHRFYHARQEIINMLHNQ